MRPEEIVVGGVYEGEAPHPRLVTLMRSDDWGFTLVYWRRIKGGYEDWSFMRHFARWAVRRVDTKEAVCAGE